MALEISVRPMKAADAPAVSRLILTVFSAFNSNDYSDTRRFTDNVTPEHLMHFSKDALSLMAEWDGIIVGVIVVIDGCHLELMFVDPSFHRQGIATRLWNVALKNLLAESDQLKEMTVNASTYGTPFYESIGFHQVRGVYSENTGVEINRMVRPGQITVERIKRW